MHVQIVHFKLRALSHDAYTELTEELAPAFAQVPGLVSKTWLADPAANLYGGVYVWADRQAMTAFGESDLFAAVVNHPNLADLSARDFAVLDAPSRVTRAMKPATV